MIFSNESCRFNDKEVYRNAAASAEECVGCTLFYADRQCGDEAQLVYLDTLDGMWELRLPL